MLSTKVSPQSDFKHQTLIAIAINLTNKLVDEKSISVSQLQDYQIWRDRTNVAIVNQKTQKLVLFATIKLQSNQPLSKSEDIVSTSLWKNIHQYYGLFSPTVSSQEIDSAWHFLRPLDPTIQNLYQSQPKQLQDSDTEIVSAQSTKKFPLNKGMAVLSSYFHVFSRPKLNSHLIN